MADGAHRRGRHVAARREDGLASAVVNATDNKTSRIAIGVIAFVLVVLVAFGSLIAIQARDLAKEASAASSAAKDMASAVVSSDFNRARTDVTLLSASARRMNDILGQPQWSVVSALPVVGGDVTSARRLCVAFEDCADNALAPLVGNLSDVPLKGMVSDGAVDVAAMQQLLFDVAAVAPVIERNAGSLSSIDGFALPPLNDKVMPLVNQFKELNEVVQGATRLAPIAGELLGANGPKRYFLAAQNSAEIRSTGGFLGSGSTITFDNGRFELGEFRPIKEIFNRETEGIAITENDIALFSDWINVSWDVGYDPHFPRAARAWKTSYENHNGQQIDGVISLTPSLVQDVLALTGPITLSDGTVLDGTNATRVILHDLYWKYLSGEDWSDNMDYVDDLFGEAANLTFHAFFADLDTSKMVSFGKALMEGVKEYRVLFWLGDEHLQSQIEGLNCSGSLTDNGQCQLGVYFSSTGNKLGWYMDITTDMMSRTENADGTTAYKMRTVFTCAVPEGEIPIASPYIIGLEEPPASIVPWVYIVAPQGATFSSFDCNGLRFVAGVHEGLNLYYDNQFSLMNPNVPVECIYTIVVPSGSPELTVRTTPTMGGFRS